MKQKNKQQTTVVLASNNAGKLSEIRAILADLPYNFCSLGEFTKVQAEESGLSFVENAILKARHACEITGLPAIADDSGLEVDCLNGEPGVFSARYAGEQATDQENNEKLIRALSSHWHTPPSARFHCVIAYLQHHNDPVPTLCHGTWRGHLVSAPRGSHGFGYDPLFHLSKHGCTAAELPSAVKNSISHRAQALTQLKEQIERG